MRYWVIKGKPSVNDLDDMLRPGKVASWRTAKPPKRWEGGDRVFFWSSAPRLELVGLGELLGPTGQFTEEGETIYRVRYLTAPLPQRVPAVALRADATCSEANFLKPAVAQGVLEVTIPQAHKMYRLLDRANGNSLRCWEDIAPASLSTVGRPATVKHEGPGTFGQGFGDAANNREVEDAAIKFVSEDYARRGWAVHSVERDKCGYDLECSRGRRTDCVEVKGVRGTLCSFFVTAAELAAARGKPNFVLIAVTDALGAPTIHRFSGPQLQRDFRFDPVAFRAVPLVRK